jgi:diguanylate cyclase (GGDEF)-like protein
MKITGAQNEPLSPLRRRGPAQAAGAYASAAPLDTTGFLGLTEADLTPQVRGALMTLMGEIDELRGEVTRLKGRLTEVEGLADRDTLTPLLNRRAFMRELSRVRTFAQRYGSPASLVYFDLDDMKTINDRFGHAAGDAVIKTVADRLTAHVRESDVVARMGGDEFAVLLVQADRPLAESKAAALAQAVEGEPLRFGDASTPIRISYGICDITQNVDAEGLVAQADGEMYDRKRARRSA